MIKKTAIWCSFLCFTYSENSFSNLMHILLSQKQLTISWWAKSLSILKTKVLSLMYLIKNFKTILKKYWINKTSIQGTPPSYIYCSNFDSPIRAKETVGQKYFDKSGWTKELFGWKIFHNFFLGNKQKIIDVTKWLFGKKYFFSTNSQNQTKTHKSCKIHA